MPKCQCAGNACNCQIVAGDGVIISGTGNASAPYQIAVASQYIPVSVPTNGPVDVSTAVTGSVVHLTMNANVTSLTLPTTAGLRIDVVIQHVVAGTTVTWPAGIWWEGGAAPAQATGANRTDWFSFRRVGSNWVGALLAGNTF
jgi:hypothetical protein